MPAYKVIAPVLVLFTSACISLPGIDPEQPDAGTPDAGVGETLEVRLVTPAEPTFTNGSIDLKVEWSGAAPDNVRLYVDDTLLTTLASSFTYRWDTASVAEGTHTLKAIGASGAKTVSSEVRTVIVDRTPPQWVSRNPAPGADNVSVRQTTFEAVFSEPLKRDTVTAQAVHVKVGSQETAVTASLSTDGKTLSINTPDPIPVDAVVSVEISGGMTDAAGNQLSDPIPAWWAWTVPAFVPIHGPLVLTDKGDHSETLCQPYLRLDGVAHPLVAWVRRVGGLSKVHVARWSGTIWELVGAPMSEFPSGSGAGGCALDLDESGRPVVAWSESDGTAMNIYVHRWNGTAWSPVGGTLSGLSGATHADSPVLVWGAGTSPTMAWRESDGNIASSKNKVFVYSWNGSSWNPLGGALNSNPTQDSVWRFSMRLEGANRPVVFWVQTPANDTTLQDTHAVRWSGSNWVPIASSEVIASGIGAYAFEVNAAGVPFVLWEQYGSVYSTSVRFWQNGSWQTAGGPLGSQPGVIDVYGASLLMDGAGYPIAAWLEPDGSGSKALMSRWNGANWVALGGAIPPQGAQGVREVAFRLDSKGDPVIGWSQFTDPAAVYFYGPNR